MFTKRTIQHRQPVTSVDTAVEALGVSIGERACVDLGFMASLMGGGDKIPQIISDLKGIIFKDPDSGPAVISEENTDWHKVWTRVFVMLSSDFPFIRHSPVTSEYSTSILPFWSRPGVWSSSNKNCL